jgi:hypothetical protein
MATNAPSDDPRPRTAVIDIHTHTFNARYLPLRGILLGKRDAKPPYTWLISDAAAGIIADAVTGHTALSEVPGHAVGDAISRPAMGCAVSRLWSDEARAGRRSRRFLGAAPPLVHDERYPRVRTFRTRRVRGP